MDERENMEVSLSVNPEVAYIEEGSQITLKAAPHGKLGISYHFTVNKKIVQGDLESHERIFAPEGPGNYLAKVTVKEDNKVVGTATATFFVRHLVDSSVKTPIATPDNPVYFHITKPADFRGGGKPYIEIGGERVKLDEKNGAYSFKPKEPGRYSGRVVWLTEKDIIVGESPLLEFQVREGTVADGEAKPVTLKRTASEKTDDQGLWSEIKRRTRAINFERYSKFIQNLFCDDKGVSAIFDDMKRRIGEKPDSRLSIHAVDAYNILRLATEIFLLMKCGVVGRKSEGFTILKNEKIFNPLEESARYGYSVSLADIEDRLTSYFGGSDKLPYLKRILSALLGPDKDKWEEKLPYCDYVLQHRLTCPSMIELIWSYWHEEGMLAQTMNAIALRFQNRRGITNRDPLVEFEIDPLRPLNSLLWGYIQNEHNRLTVMRRAYEYDHHYGITLYGKAVPKLNSADSRSKFLEGFHNLLYMASVFYKEDADTTVVADAFPLLTALREIHIILAEGAHNQFGDLPWTARTEMMVEQWMLGRPQMQEFLRGRPMVPYKEEWMGRVDAMKKLQSWTDTTITHFNDLATYGEQILLTVRYGDWIDVNDEDQAKNWARYWKPEIQSYIHAYRAATGVDLTSEPVDTTAPWVHLKRIEDQRTALRA